MKALIKRTLRPWLTPIRELREFRRRRAPIPLSVAVAGGGVDSLLALPDGIVAATGWSPDLGTFERALALRINGIDRPPSHVFRVPRPDVEARAPGSAFAGAVAEWVIESSSHARRAGLVVGGEVRHALTLPALPPIPYGHLHLHPDVVGRDGIYSFGPPVHIVSEEVLQLARRLPAPILDFGCGGGALVRALRREGIEAYGLEINDERIRTHLLDEARPYVTLYDGSLPAPFVDRQFSSVTCSEVLEHIPGHGAAIAEMARLASSTLFITVPDMSAIPRGFPHNVVPWHLLESTHVNFFTQHSLASALAPHVSSVEFSRIGAVRCDQMLYYTCLAATATRAGTPR